jgi:hypothetical protein
MTNSEFGFEVSFSIFPSCIFVGFQILTTAVMKTTLVWNMLLTQPGKRVFRMNMPPPFTRFFIKPSW